jgi:hypothetical protein
MPSRPSEFPAAPRISAEPSRKIFFPFLEVRKKWRAQKSKIVKKIFLRGITAALRRLAAGSA